MLIPLLDNVVPEVTLMTQWRGLTMAATFWDLLGIDSTVTSLVALGKKKGIIVRRLLQAFQAKYPDKAAQKEKLDFYRLNYNDQRQVSERGYWSFG